MPNLAEKIDSLPPEIRMHAEAVIDDLVELSNYRSSRPRAKSGNLTPDEWLSWADDAARKVGALSKGGDATLQVQQMRARA